MQQKRVLHVIAQMTDVSFFIAGSKTSINGKVSVACFIAYGDMRRFNGDWSKYYKDCMIY